ncbi:hypothetical protein ACLI1A_02985 [Flavobacterium sp. RHBU_3]|uniref:hypothetical protein n=1 Tax=Flavobacterium sp. RHBU_3 TaxID=3391184 RepID=UPI00398538B3
MKDPVQVVPGFLFNLVEKWLMYRKSSVLERRAHQFALGLQTRKLYPAAIICAGKSYYKKVDRSKPFDSQCISNKLRLRLLTIGDIHSKQNGNLIGYCAEVNAANHVMLKLKHLNPEEVNFSSAIRPRTMQKMPPCKNCKLTFNI